MGETDVRKKTETNAFADFLSQVMPPGQAIKVPPPPPPLSPMPAPPKLCRGTMTDVTSELVNVSPYGL